MSPTKNDVGLWETEIDGEKYEFEKWGAEDAMDVLLDLASIAGKPLGMGVAALFGGKDAEGEKKSVLEKDVDPNVIGSIMEALTDRVSANKATCKMLIKKIASEKVLCNGQKINFNSHYQDRLPLVFKVVKAGLEVQYGNFFAAFLGASGIKVPKGITNRVLAT